ncbi:hypothetical protein O3P69_009227 [Scylla paramamosain]|uniref:Uncharacterized protein n=1 Tax=Scylla paramamosain TaxID=85552 RepID=A0AAW0TCX2_SCYPA
MERVLPCPLLLLLLLALSPGGAPSPTLAQDCSAADTVVKKGQLLVQVINTTQVTWDGAGYGGHLTLFVKPESDFEGVSLYAGTRDRTLHTAWFPAEECFPRDGTWLQFRAMISATWTSLKFRFRSPACWKECETNTVLAMPTILSVVAQGPSRWLTGHPPENCRFQMLGELQRDKMERCKHPPSTTTTSTTTTTTTTTTTSTSTTSTNTSTNTTTDPTSKLTRYEIITIAASAAAGVVVVLVVVVVVVLRWKRKVVISPALSLPPDEHVIENDIYESFDGDANDAAPQTFQNDLYESFSGHERRRDT